MQKYEIISRSIQNIFILAGNLPNNNEYNKAEKKIK